MDFPPPTAKQAKTIWAAATLLAVSVLVTLIVGFIWGIGFVLQVLSPVLWPLAIAAALAYLLDPVVDFIAHRKVSRFRATMLVFAFAVAALIAVVGLILPQAVREAQQFAQSVPDYKERIEKKIDSWMERPPALLSRLLDIGRPESDWIDRLLRREPKPEEGETSEQDTAEESDIEAGETIRDVPEEITDADGTESPSAEGYAATTGGGLGWSV